MRTLELSKTFLEKQKLKTSKLEVSIRLHGNPFVQKELKSIYNIVTKSEVPEKFQHGISNVEEYARYVKERMQPSSTVSIWSPLSKFNVGSFSSVNEKPRTKSGDAVIELMQSRGLMGRVELFCQSNREFELKDIFRNYKLQVVPKSLMSVDGHVLPGDEGKSPLLKSFRKAICVTRYDRRRC